MGLCLLFNSPDSRHKSASQDLVGNAITKRAGSIVEIAKAVDKLSERCSAGTPPNVQSAFCRQTASAVKLSPLFVLDYRSGLLIAYCGVNRLSTLTWRGSLFQSFDLATPQNRFRLGSWGRRGLKLSSSARRKVGKIRCGKGIAR
jgi:hypothetical protein